MLLFLIAGISLAGLAGIYMVTQIYQMVKLDAFYRGLKHPKLWAFFASTGQRGDGLIVYLLRRKNHPRNSMSDEDFLAFQTCKHRAIVALLFQLTGAILAVAALALSYS